MKRVLILLLALVMCLGCFAACTDPTEGGDASALSDAVEYLRSIYKDDAKETPADYDVVGRIKIGEASFTVTWTVDLDTIAIKESSKSGFYTVDLPSKNETAVDYKLTATVADADGKTEQVVFERTLPVFDSSAVVDKPEEGVAYKFYLVHAGLGQTLFANGETDNEKFLKTTTDPKAAPDFYVEADGEGFKFYTTINGAKKYLKASTTKSEDGKVSKYVNYADEGTTWTYKTATKGWYTTIDGTEYVVGTYGSYNTFSLSEGTYLTVDNSGKTQFPGGLMLKETAEAMTPSEGPTIYETPEEIVNAVYELDLGGYLSGGHEYTLTGVITEIPSPWSDDYGNISVVIVVGDMTDKPIECFRLKGEGANNLEVGNTITVKGKLTKYNNNTEAGKVEFDAGCVLVSSNACAHVEEIIPGKDATCTEAGLTEGKKCTTCGDILVEQTEIAALGHDWNAVLAHDDDNHWTTCTRCDEIKDKNAHNNGDDSVCDTCGYGCEHKEVNEATCTTPATCKDCGANTAPAKGHTEETIPAVAPTCKDTGLTEGKKCSVCGETLVAQETVPVNDEHSYTDAGDTTCDICGEERELSATVSAPVANVAYKLFLNQVNSGKILFATSEISSGKFIVGTTDAKAALDFYAEAVGSGFKFYTEIGGAKKYLNAYTEDNAGKISKYLGYADSTDAVWSYKADINAWVVTINGADYVLGTYNTYDTFSISDIKFITADNTGKTQFPGNLTVKSVGEAADFADKLGADSSSPSQPSTGSLDAKTPEVGKAYKFAFIQENVGTDIYYLTGAKSSYYMATSKTKADGADFYVESTNGGYYLYCMVGGAKKYVNMVVNGTHVNGEFQDTATTVYTYDTTLKTLKAVVNDADYIFGTRNDNTYTTLGPVKASNNPFYAQFIQ